MQSQSKSPSNLQTKLFLSAALLCSVTFVGCNYKVSKSDSGDGGGQISKENLPTFNALAAQVLGPKCFICHDGAHPPLVDLSNYDKFMAHVNNIRGDVSSGSMPKSPGQPLTATEKNLVLSWIDGGAPKDGGQKPIETPTPLPTPAQPPAHSGTVDFKMVYDKVLKNKCSGCHDGTDADPKVFDISDYTEIFKRVDAVKERIARHGDGQMPPADKDQLTVDEKALLNTWLNDGAPQKVQPTPQAELLPTYKSISKNIFENKCMSCHAEGKKNFKDYALEPLSAIVMGQDQQAIVKKDANSTKLIHSVLRTDAKKRMPRKADPLTQQEVDTLKKWIALGCPQ
jgi:uncharacterized membrane protein